MTSATMARLGAALGLALILAGPKARAGGGEGEDRNRDPAAACSGLAGMSVSAGSIGLPTGGATVDSASLVAPAGPLPEYCKVLGSIHPLDPAAPDIHFEVNLPSGWNGKALHFGGGGYDGTLITGLGNVPFGPLGGPVPLAQGYATFGSDSGHQSPSPLDGSFALNDEALANFGGAQLKKTHDVALKLIEARYGEGPRRTYFAGNSQGGHEALTVAQRWPQDYRGVLVTHPAYDFTALQLSGNRAGKALYGPGAWVDPAKAALLGAAVLAACDGLDGVVDGLVSDVAGCDRAFDVRSLRCPGGGDAGDGCLSDAQIGALEVMNTPLELPVVLQGGLTAFARWPIFEGADLTGLWGLGARPMPSLPPTPVADFGLHTLADPMVRFFITRDPSFDSLRFDPAQWLFRIGQVSHMVDASDPNLSAFRALGGKMLLMHGTADFAITPHNTIAYYQRLVSYFGQRGVDEFVRFYLVPGFGHGGGPFLVSWDSLGALERWVEHGVAPGTLVATDANAATRGRTRPMCLYPAWPRYAGGDPDAASSYQCLTREF